MNRLINAFKYAKLIGVASNNTALDSNDDFESIASNNTALDSNDDFEGIASNNTALDSNDDFEGIAQLFNTDKFEADNIISDVASMFEEKEVIAPVIFTAPVVVEAPKAPVVDEAANIAAFRKVFF